MKHALAEERPAEADAVEAADQRLAVINLDAMAVAALVELAIEIANTDVDPGSAAARHRFGAAVDDCVEIAIGDHREPVGTHGAGKTVRNVKTIERYNAAPFGLDPVKCRIVSAFRHRENATGIGLEQHFGRDVDECVFAARHENRLTASCRPVQEAEWVHIPFVSS